MKFLNLLVFLLALQFSLSAQSPGDTILVQSLNYSSSTRDTTINFPNNPNISYEKVIMRYAMRCKNALVSTGSNRNLGCGEWDYSCNTYIHEPSLADSVLRSIQKYQIAPSSSPTGMYSTVPTWSGIPTVQTSVVINATTSEDSVVLGNSVFTDSTFINSRANGKSYIIYTATELINAGMIAGDIDGLMLNSISSNVKVNKLRIKLKHTSLSNLNQVDTAIFNGTQEVYFHDYTFQNGLNRIQFYAPFTWDGVSNVIVECNYNGKSSNSALFLKSNTSASSIGAIRDYSSTLFSGNYIEADSYLGISNANARTVEAWIKTTSGGEITTWGTNAQAQKQSFYVNGAGKLRLEINGAYAVGNTVVNDGNWHHVAFTFSGTNMYDVRFYVDGKWDFSSLVSTKNMNTQLSKLFQVSKGFHNRYFNGQIDDVRVWSAALNLQTIRDWRFKKVFANHIIAANVHPNLSSLELGYDFNANSAIITDFSVNQNNAVFESSPSFYKFDGEDMVKGYETYNLRPDVIFLQGTYNLSINSDTLIDTLYNDPYFVTENTIYPRWGTTQTDSIGSVLSTYYPPNNITYDLSGAIVSNTPSSSTLTITNQSLDYYQRNPSKLEIMSFVTPYGINLDLGVDGEAWYFDVSDFLPVLKGSKRMTLERGGQNQEEMDIQFLFIVGTPPAEVKKIQEIWKVDQRNYSDIIADVYFAPRSVKLDTSGRRYKIRSAITGHGQQGEFIARNHTLSINNGAALYNNLVWKECAENPVYPQGGTWIYDRAGWCPGMATDIEEYDITNLINGDSVWVDYNVQGATGDSRYIVSNQLVTYGPANFQNDARIFNVIRPNNQSEFGKNNPMCYNPIVTIQNTGSSPLTSATIQYSINGGAALTHTWSGNLGFMDKANTQLNISQSFWSTANPGINTFTATITGVNGGADQYVHNNTYNSKFEMPDVLPANINIVLKTNSAAHETSYTLKNGAGATVLSRSGFSNNQTYSNALNLPPDCYQLRVFDSGDDGLSFFANSSGTGYLRITAQNGSTLSSFNPDYGDGVIYYFTVANSTGIESDDVFNRLEVYPNPASDELFISYENIEGTYQLINTVGQTVMSGKLKSGNTNMRLDISNIAVGVYYLKINSNNNSSTNKIIIN